MDRNALPESASTAGLQSENISVSVGSMVARFLRTLLTNRAGAITVEYAMLVGMVGITGATALLTFGPAIATSYENTRGTILLPIP